MDRMLENVLSESKLAADSPEREILEEETRELKSFESVFEAIPQAIFQISIVLRTGILSK